MEKEISQTFRPLFQINLEKRAGIPEKDNIAPDMKEFILNLTPDPKYLYLLSTPVGASEYYGCFPETCKISMPEGNIKYIKDIKLGDKVLTHKNCFRKVSKVFHHPSTLRGKATIKLMGYIEDLESTVNHPYLVVSKKQWKNKRTYWIRDLKEDFNTFKDRQARFFEKLNPVWKKAEELERGDRIIFSLKHNVLEESNNELIKNIPFLCGMYVSEGNIAKANSTYNPKYRNRGLCFVTNVKEIHLHDKIRIDVEKLGKRINTHKRSYLGSWKPADPNSPPNVCVQAMSYHELAEEMLRLFGEHAKTKFIHPEIMSMPIEWKREFLTAFFWGDGCQLTKNKSLDCATVSKDLAEGLQKLLWSIGIPASARKCVMSSGWSIGNFVYRISIPQNYVGELNYFLPAKESMQHGRIDVDTINQQVFIRVDGVDFDVYQEPTYNIEVEQDNSYIANGFIVHNSNNNFDFWPETGLNPNPPTDKYGYKTFEAAHIFRGHVNKDPEISVGKIAKACYNQEMHRVEVVMMIDKDKAPDIVNKVNSMEEKKASGEVSHLDFGISLGCRLVDGDICSICGNQARSRMEYCSHLANQMGEVMPDGKKVQAINPHPIFFDLSIVENPAAKEAAIMKKIAQDLSQVRNSHTVIEARNTYSVNESPHIKQAKNIISNLSNKEDGLNTTILKSLAGSDNFMNIIKTASVLGMVLKPDEFQFLALLKAGKEKIAEEYNKFNIVMPVISSMRKIDDYKHSIFSKSAAEILNLYFKERTSFDPFLSIRLMEKAKIKIAAQKTEKIMENPLLIELSKLYNGYREVILGDITQEKIADNIMKNPELLKLFLDSGAPEIKMASFREYETPSKIAEGMIGKVSYTYLLLV